MGCSNYQVKYDKILSPFKQQGFNQNSQITKQQLKKALGKICSNNPSIKALDQTILQKMWLETVGNQNNSNTVSLSNFASTIIKLQQNLTNHILKSQNELKAYNISSHRKRNLQQIIAQCSDDLRILTELFEISDEIKNQFKQIEVHIVTIKQTVHKVRFDENDSVLAVKKYIFNNLTDSLEVKKMSLKAMEEYVSDNTKLKQIQKTEANKLQLKQCKKGLHQIPNLIVDINRQDQFSGERGCAKMRCGHYIGRQFLIELIQYYIKQKSPYIKCPFDTSNGTPCKVVWSFEECEAVGVFTKEEKEEFSKNFNQNWKIIFTKQCPYCKRRIIIKENQSEFKCVECKIIICSECGKKMQNEQQCTSEICTSINNMLEKAPWNKQFRFQNPKNGEWQVHMTPNVRACPNCRLFIMSESRCKKVACSMCGTYFCWVCLNVGNPSSYLKCGSWSDFCGKVVHLTRKYVEKNLSD